MSVSSRTGLVPTPKRNIRLVRKINYSKEPCSNELCRLQFEGRPMPLSLRPFGSLFNPFAKGCSVLCNHPAPTEVKDIIHQLKTTLAVEGRNLHHGKDNSLAQQAEHDNIPEDLFRRYTDTDSRPLTPTPTVTSVHTRTSAGSFLNRRCITPEWGKNEVIKRKKLILDLRRSHSQETLYWKPSSDLSQSGGPGNESLSEGKPKSAGANEEKKPKRQKSEEQRPRSSLAVPIIPEEEDAKKPAAPTCINDRGFDDDDDVRRGKKRKKLKPTPATTTFHLSDDPETQVAALGPDSLNPSTRPSLIPNSASLLPNKEKQDSEPVLLKGSFLTDEAFQALKTELDVDVIENTFERYLNRARREAIRYIAPKPKVPLESAGKVEKPIYKTEDKMPRKFSKSSTRFDVPLNLQTLEKMSVLDYLSQHVWVSRQRKQLYKRVFLKYLKKIDEHPKSSKAVQQNPNDNVRNPNPNADEEQKIQRMEYIERTMRTKSLSRALADVLEFHGTESNIKRILELLDYENMEKEEIDFRTWCGIVSFGERLALDDPNGTDSCDELEKADFSSLEQRLTSCQVSTDLKEVFDIIRRTHNLGY